MFDWTYGKGIVGGTLPATARTYGPTTLAWDSMDMHVGPFAISEAHPADNESRKLDDHVEECLNSQMASAALSSISFWGGSILQSCCRSFLLKKLSGMS